MHELLALDDLVTRARAGDQASWNALVDRFLPLVNGVIRRFRLSSADADDVNQTVWLRLVEHLGDLREPRALPGWLVTTTRNEALRVIRLRGRAIPVDPQGVTLERLAEQPEADEELIRDERTRALRAGSAGAAGRPARAARAVARRPAHLLRRDQREAGHPQRQHRPDPGPGSGTTAEHPGDARPGDGLGRGRVRRWSR